MLPVIIYSMICGGSVLMVYNIYGFIRFSRYVRGLKSWKDSSAVLYFPIVLLVFFLAGYLAVGFLGNPDLIVSGILFGGSIFVFIMYKTLLRVVRQITEAEQREAVFLAAQESSRVKSNFLANMSHEMRTPMNVILGLTTLSLSDPSLSPKTRGNLEKIRLSGQRFMSLINSILDLNNIERGEFAVRNDAFPLLVMLAQVDAIANTLCEEKGLDYRTDYPESAAGIFRGDPLLLSNVLLNILENAVKYTQAPGQVLLTLAMGAKAPPESGSGGGGSAAAKDDNASGGGSSAATKDDNASGGGGSDKEDPSSAPGPGKVLCSFIVSDTGIGIDPDFLPHVFETFSREDASSTSRFGGSGLGLSLTKSIVELMGGSITAKSEKGVGSTFTVVLPLERCPKGTLPKAGPKGGAPLSPPRAASPAAQDAADRPAKSPAPSETPASAPADAPADGGQQEPEISLEGRRILIVEDLPANAEIVEDLLDLEGAETEHAENGQIGLDMVAASEAGYYDAVLMDLRMPVMDGLEAARRIRALDRPDTKTIPIIALTANAFESDVKASLEAGMNAHLAKPTDADQLYSALKQAIRDNRHTGRSETS